MSAIPRMNPAGMHVLARHVTSCMLGGWDRAPLMTISLMVFVFMAQGRMAGALVTTGVRGWVG